MAERPVFVPTPEGPGLVKTMFFELVWNPGFAAVQKKKNIKALHEAAARAGCAPLLEISTKSAEKVGQHLSAFHLKVSTEHCGDIPLECVFQGSKVFERGGPYTDLYAADVRSAKRDPRLRESGRLVGFEYEGLRFPIEPRTVFYDWLYIGAILPHREWLKRLYAYAGFTDIEFNPKRSLNCQARACALFVSLMRLDLLEQSMLSPAAFIDLITQREQSDPPRGRGQESLFSK